MNKDTLTQYTPEALILKKTQVQELERKFFMKLQEQEYKHCKFYLRLTISCSAVDVFYLTLTN
jgi:hypothetical protein